MADKKSRELDEDTTKGITVKIDVDVSEALTGLKAVQREAKKATADLRELEAKSHNVGFEDDSVISAIQRSYEVVPDAIEVSAYVLSDVPTAELSRELAKREGVSLHEIARRGDKMWVNVHSTSGSGVTSTATIGTALSTEGPAKILVIKD